MVWSHGLSEEAVRSAERGDRQLETEGREPAGEAASLSADHGQERWASRNVGVWAGTLGGGAAGIGCQRRPGPL